MVRVIPAIQLRMLFENRLVARLQLCPHVRMAGRNVRPRAAVASSAVIGAPVRNSLFDRRTNPLQILGEIAGGQLGLHGHHAAADVHADGRRDDRALGRDHAADRSADAPVDVRHGGDPLENERQLRHVEQLLARLRFQRHSLGPGLDGHTLFGNDHVVGRSVRHFLSPFQFSPGAPFHTPPRGAGPAPPRASDPFSPRATAACGDCNKLLALIKFDLDLIALRGSLPDEGSLLRACLLSASSTQAMSSICFSVWRFISE